MHFRELFWMEKLKSVYNKKKRKLFPTLKNQRTLSKFSDFTDVFIVDSTPIEIYKISRANRSAICSTDEIKPSFGYCAAQKSGYFGYKLHAVCDKNGIFHSFDFSLQMSMMLTILMILKKILKLPINGR